MTASFVRSAWVLAALFAATMVVAWASRVGVGAFVRRVWASAGLFAVLISYVAITMLRRKEPSVPAAAATAAAPKAAATAPPTATVDDVRASVEAAIAARKAELSGASPAAAPGTCSTCQSSVDPGDAFCRSCGAKQSA